MKITLAFLDEVCGASAKGSLGRRDVEDVSISRIRHCDVRHHFFVAALCRRPAARVFFALFDRDPTRSGNFFLPVSRFHSSKVSLEIFPSTRSCANLRRCAWLLNGIHASIKGTGSVSPDQWPSRTTARPTAASDAAEISCALTQYCLHGSLRRLASLRGIFNSVQRSGRSSRSFQSTGIDTVAAGRARGENAQTDVLVRLFLR